MIVAMKKKKHRSKIVKFGEILFVFLFSHFPNLTIINAVSFKSTGNLNLITIRNHFWLLP